MSKCFKCASDVIWGGNHMYDECGLDGEGIVSNHTCSNDNCRAFYQVYEDINVNVDE